LRAPLSTTIAVVGCFAAILVGAPAMATAGSAVPAGYDLFETDPGSTVFRFNGPGAIPAGFFGPSSDPFTGNVNFGGVPLQTFNGLGTGDADTIVRRPQAASNPPQTVPIELVALNLVSVEPITVTTNGGSPQAWDVTVGLSPTRRSQGQAQIIPAGEHGGLMNSQLQVFPQFTFTRLSDGTVRTLNGANLQPNQVTLQAQQVPWARGCVLPALAVSGLNDQFCPGLVVNGVTQKVLTVEQSLLAQHGIYPAQPSGAPGHYKCYKLKPKRFSPQNVTLTDQFGTRQANVPKRTELCNPVQKNQEPWDNRRAHLQCYKATGPSVGRVVAVQNQFGSQRLQVTQPRSLCVPSEKRKVQRSGKKGQFKPIEVPIDHAQCYDVVPQSPLQRVGLLEKVKLKDQFGTEKKVKVRDPKYLCTPTQKNDERVQHPVKHLVCYAIKDDKVRKTVQVRNQFEQKTVKTKKPVSLCVPSNKLVIQ
jgi:hypothetical protein